MIYQTEFYWQRNWYRGNLKIVSLSKGATSSACYIASHSNYGLYLSCSHNHKRDIYYSSTCIIEWPY